jgi:hypothetical protein
MPLTDRPIKGGALTPVVVSDIEQNINIEKPTDSNLFVGNAAVTPANPVPTAICDNMKR